MSVPALFQTLFGQNGQAFAKAINQVDGSSVMIDAAFALEAVPVRSQPVDVEAE